MLNPHFEKKTIVGDSNERPPEQVTAGRLVGQLVSDEWAESKVSILADATTRLSADDFDAVAAALEQAKLDLAEATRRVEELEQRLENRRHASARALDTAMSTRVDHLRQIGSPIWIAIADLAEREKPSLLRELLQEPERPVRWTGTEWISEDEWQRIEDKRTASSAVA